jgi:hypothetical protein
VSPELEKIRSSRASLVSLSVAVAASASSCVSGTKAVTAHDPGRLRTAVREI